MKKLLTTIMMASILVGCSKPAQVKKTEEPALTTSFYVSTDTQKIVTEDEAKGKMVIDWYYDGACGSCQYLDTELVDSYTDTLTVGKVVKYIPSAFIGQNEKSYSAQYAGYQLAVNEVDKEHGVQFMNKMMNYLDNSIDRKKFTDETFKKKYLEIKGTTEETFKKILEKKDNYVKAVVSESKNILESKKLTSYIPDGASNLYIPFIIPGHANKSILFKNVETEEDMKKLLKKTITEQVEKDKQFEAEQKVKKEDEKMEKAKQNNRLLMIAGGLVAVSVIGLSIIVIKHKSKNKD